MNQCVPSWELDDTPTPPKLPLQTQSNSLAPDVPSLDYEVAELTWENGQLAMHGLGPPRVPNNKPISNYGGTLESIVNQGTRSVPHHHQKFALDGSGHGGDEVVPWFNYHHVVADTPLVPGSLTMAKDALVPCSANSNYHRRPPSSVQVPGLDGSTHVGSCSGATNNRDWMAAPLVGTEPTHEGSSRADMSVSGSATCAGDSRQLTVDTYDREMGTGMYTSTSMGSPENTSSDKQCTNRTGDDHDSVCHSRSKREVGDEEDEKKGS
uniref:Transcription factor UNE10-like n=1 Tax=Nicotiana tabacum TaxID=4097 RepID=A0A1S4BC58_TOBAC